MGREEEKVGGEGNVTKRGNERDRVREESVKEVVKWS